MTLAAVLVVVSFCIDCLSAEPTEFEAWIACRGILKPRLTIPGRAGHSQEPQPPWREGGAVTAARIAFKYLIAPNEPANEGAFRALNVEIPEGKFLSAKAPAPTTEPASPTPPEPSEPSGK